MSWVSLVAYIGIAAIFLFTVIAIVLHALPTGYTLLRNPLSDFATGSSRALMTGAFLILGIGVLLMAIGLGPGLHERKRVAVGVFFIAVFGASRLLVAFFPSDVDGAGRTTVGRIHSLLTAFGFIAIPLGAIALTPVLRYTQGWAGVAPTLRLFELLISVFALAVFVTRIRALRGVFGAAEKLLYASSLIWLFVLGLRFALLKH